MKGEIKVQCSACLDSKKLEERANVVMSRDSLIGHCFEPSGIQLDLQD